MNLPSLEECFQAGAGLALLYALGLYACTWVPAVDAWLDGVGW